MLQLLKWMDQDNWTNLGGLQFVRKILIIIYHFLTFLADYIILFAVLHSHKFTTSAHEMLNKNEYNITVKSNSNLEKIWNLSPVSQ